MHTELEILKKVSLSRTDMKGPLSPCITLFTHMLTKCNPLFRENGLIRPEKGLTIRNKEKDDDSGTIKDNATLSN